MSSKDQLLSFLQQAGPASAEKVGLKTTDSSFALSLPPLDLDSTAKKVAELDLTALRSLTQDKERALQYTNEFQRKLRDLRAAIAEIERRIVLAGDEQSHVDARRKQLDQIFKNLLITHVEYVDNNVTIFTTHFLKVKNRMLGVYRIWIDWNHTHADNGIRILNFYKRYGHYDHPCINNGDLCMGTAEETISRHFQQKNMFVLLETLIAFILSENVEHGFIHDWDTWLGSRSAVPVGFSFESMGIRPYRVTQPQPRRSSSIESIINNSPF